MEVNIKELAIGVADYLQITDGQLDALSHGLVPIGWSNAIIDELQSQFNIEELLIKELTK